MTPVILPPGGSAVVSAVSSTSHPTVFATVPDSRAAGAQLEAGSIVTGTVLGRDAQGQVVLRTDKGLLSLSTHIQLPVGSTVSLEVRVAGARLQLVILSVEPPAGEAARLSPAALAGGGTAGATATPTPAATPATMLAAALTGGSLVMATVVHAALPAMAGRPIAAPPGAAQTPPAPGGAGSPATGAAPISAPAAATATPPPAAGAGGLPGQIAGGMPPAGQTASEQLLALQIAAANPAAPASGGGAGSAAALAANLIQSVTAPDETAGAVPKPPPGSAGQPPGPTPGSSMAPGSGAAVPAGAPAALPPAPLAGTSAPLLGAAPPPTASSPPLATGLHGPAQAPLTPGTEVGVRILAAALPGEPPPAAGARPAGAPPVTAAQVIGQTPSGHPIVDTPAGRLILAVKAALPAGATLLLELPLPGQIPAPAPGAPVSSPQQALLRLAQGWPALGEALATLAAHGELAAAQALAARLPGTGSGLAAATGAMTNLWAAGVGGVGRAPARRDALGRSGRRDLADSLSSEFRQASRLAGEPASGDWRVMFLPLRHEGELHQINLYLRGRRKGDKDDPDTGTRFVVEIDMTRLGPIQLDGLVHGRRFDLMLRSRGPLSPAMRRDIEAIFDEARGIGGYAGAIGFQVAASFPVQPLEQAKGQAPANAVVV